MNGERVRWIRTILSRLFRRRRQEAALAAELQFHFDQLVAEYRAQGMPEDQARLAAQREFGAVDVYREEIRDTWRPPALADLGRSVRFAVRSLARTPGFTVIALMTLALGIGANTAMFSVVDTVAFKPLPYPDTERLEQVFRTTPQNAKGALSGADFLDLRSESGRYGEIAAYAYGDVSLAQPGKPADFAQSVRVTANFFDVLGIALHTGRDFRAPDEVRGNHRVLVISDRCWQNRFGGRADVIGSIVRVDGDPHEIVGVLPKSFNDWRHLGWVDLFRPLGLTAEEATDRGHPLLHVFGRRAPEIAADDAAGFIAHLGAQLAADHPDVNAGATWRTVPIDDVRLGETGGIALAMLVGLSGFVLLIACSNLANFLLARTMARAREFAVRGALGASRLHLLWPLLLEALLLALAGGACAVLVAMWGTSWIQTASTGDNGEQVVFTLKWNVLAWAFAASLFTALAFGLAPSLFAMRLDVNATLKSGGRSVSGSRGHQRLRHALIVGQFALAMVLLCGAALMIRGLHDLNNRREGWSSEALVTGTFRLPETTYPGPEAIAAFERRVLERLAALPGVESASLSFYAPFLNWYSPRKFLVEAQELPEPGREPAALVNSVSPDYFATVGTRLVAGRVFDARDAADAPRTFIISQAMAAALFGAESPIGRRIAFAAPGAPEWGEVVGVAQDVKSIFPDPQPVPFQLYQPLTQETRAEHELAVRVSGVAPVKLVDSIRTLMAELDANLPVTDLKPADTRIARANYQLGVLGDMLSSFAVLGLGLAAMGIYGVIARVMAQRMGEFGIRLALGAQLRDIRTLVLTTGVKLAAVGSILGLLGAIGVAGLLGMAFPLMRLERGPVIVGATLVLIVVALVACYLPARRAARINPTEVLRAD